MDIGCGTGYFLKKCQENGWRITGTEPDNGARQKAKDLTAKEIYGNIDEIKAIKEFNVITLWHVLEHIHDPVKALVKIKELLKDEGTLIIAVPNLESNDSKYYQETWAAYDVPRHLYHFSKTALNNLLTQTGFQLIETKPMKFDSYYVSMLSEKYKGTNNLLNAFITGYKSNLKAKKKNQEITLVSYISQE
ncbi:MAG: class I SAM-dependent methyltransferase [Sporocytophaga sp.]|nr:class I SAM-dependent methyltransferase [Sporocytophaga sp.]